MMESIPGCLAVFSGLLGSVMPSNEIIGLHPVSVLTWAILLACRVALLYSIPVRGGGHFLKGLWL